MLPSGHPFAPRPQPAPPVSGRPYPRHPLQDSIDRIRASQQAQPAQTGPSQEEMLAAINEVNASNAEQQRQKDEQTVTAANQQAWMNQQVADIPIQQTTPDPYSEAQPLDQRSEADKIQAIMDKATPAGTGIAVQPMPESGPVTPVGGFGTHDRRAEAGDRRAKETRRQQRGGWGDPADSPLPGEETLPPAVAQWNQARASSGSGGGLAALRSAYDVAEANVPSGKTFEEWVSAQGIRPDTPPMEAQAILEDIVSRNMSEFPNADPLMTGAPDLRVDQDDDSILYGRRGVADSTPLDLMSPEQRQKIGSHLDGTPRTARGGYHVWDETAGERGAYVPRGANLPAAQAAQDGGDIRGEAAAYGIDHMAYGDNLPQLEADVARVRNRQQQLSRMYDTQEVPGGGTRLVPNKYAREQDDARRTQQFASTMTNRFAREMKENNLSPQDLAASYREGLANSGGDRAGAARFVNDKYLNTMRLQQVQDRRLAVQQRADQYNRGVDYGMSRGQMSFFDSMQNAQTPQERANLLMLAHGSQPGMGWDKMAAMLMRGEIDNNAITQWSAQMGGNKPSASGQVAANVQDFSGAIGDMSTYAQIHHHVMSMPGMAQAKPEVARAEIARYAMPIVQRVVSAGSAISPDQAAFIRSVTSEDAEEFSGQVGIPQNDPRFAPLYQSVFGRKPAQGWGGNLAAVGGWLFGGGGLQPQAYAQGDSAPILPNQ